MPAEFRFRAGQYLEVMHPDGPVPLSIASAPWRLPELHLHYRSTPGLPEASRMDALLAHGGDLEIRGPGGDVTLELPLAAPALIAAGGTGIAQAMSFVDAFDKAPPDVPVKLLWCVDDEAELYLGEELDPSTRPWLELTRIADPQRSERNRAMIRLGEQAAALAPDSPVVLAGGPGFVYAACDVLEAAGVAPENLRSDVFSYAPRP